MVLLRCCLDTVDMGGLCWWDPTVAVIMGLSMSLFIRRRRIVFDNILCCYFAA